MGYLDVFRIYVNIVIYYLEHSHILFFISLRPSLLWPSGGIYEYTVENASSSVEPNLEKRTAKLQRQVAKRAEEVRRNTLRLEFQPPPGELRLNRPHAWGCVVRRSDVTPETSGK